MELNYWIDHFYRASLFAKAIYILLFGLSVWAWAIMFRKTMSFRRSARDNLEFFALYRKNRRDPFALYRHLQQTRQRHSSPLVALFLRACEEIDALSQEDRGQAGGERRLSLAQVESLEEIMFAEMDKISGSLERGQNFLATTSSVSPLLGLLGTVWGILEAFRAIGIQGSATAASMAPGMAEALITTVAGLMVAIPANLGYNFLGQKAKDMTLEGDNFVTEFITNLQRFWGLK
jgi:biopolymer transport protein TolQ